MQISYHGHSVVKIKTNAHTILIDPFITGNGQTDLIASEEKADVILLTHGHNDHFGDTVDLAKRNNATVIAIFELAEYVESLGIKVHAMGIGGAYDFEFGRVKFTQAFHSSSYTTEGGETIYGGMPAGVLLTIEDKTIYHAGDTALFGDMKLIGERNDIDVAFLPIGDNFTMGPEDAAYAVQLLKPQIVVPIHYNTFPPIKQDPQLFKNLVDSAEVQVLNAGDHVQLKRD
ncbi:L-ascorbate metabolism protein UlaG, beta-lactamase superfamily [Psychrobacillus sp. OK028]|uniref:metal-dependent hydrolase n=1 Tax=Psychrobacillus sp. OK028 TaxID=1884359 RepID=UPI000886B535|nr:metal-dependent hydrolase [Psychrobacillus sp. OK028]SDM74433.1 L-ascorbate metabolism protein UlaG, beta-lactamase superfamily [Psychrobacillus sp. OK028]